MKMELHISGMKCAHCQAACEEALNGVAGVTAKADFKKGKAEVQMPEGLDTGLLEKAVAEAGFKVESIKEKKGLFGR